MIAVVLPGSSLSEAWLSWMIERSVAGAATLVIVGLVLFLLRRRLSAHAPSHLLLLPVMVMLLPMERALPSYWPAPIPATRTGETMTAPAPDDGVRSNAVPRSTHAEGRVQDAGSAAASGAHAGGAPDQTPLTILDGLFALWVLITLAGVAWIIVRQVAADKKLRRLSTPPPQALQQRFDDLCSERGFDRPIALQVVPGLGSPFASGVVRRAVYVPASLADELSPVQVRFVLLHELEHHARRDVLVEGLLQAVRFAFWFHPVSWVVAAAHRRWREYACDEAAVARAGTSKRAPVADALITLLHLARDAHPPAGAMASFSPSTQTMKTRLERILDRKRSPHRSLSVTSLAMMTLVGLGALTAARAQQPSASRDAADQAPAAPPRKPDGDVARAISQGIAWLLQTQQADGSWAIGPDPVGQPTYRDHNQVHVTGLALRAILLGWTGPRRLEVVRAVELGDDFLQRSQNNKGLIGAGEPLASTYGHAQAIRALSAIQQVIPDDQRKGCIQRAVEWAEQARNPYMGWRYQPRDGDNDSKHTALMLLALHEAQQVGIEVPARAMESGRALLGQLTGKGTGRTGFTRQGELMSRFVNKIGDFPRKFSEEPTAMRLLVEATFDNGVGEDAVLALSADLVRAVPPKWDPAAGTIDYAYWCFGAQAMALVGGDHAQVWRRSTHEALLPNRIVDGDAAHWPAIDPWSREGMEAYATASAMLALSVLP